MRDRHSVILRVVENETILETGDGRRLSYKHGGLDGAARHLLWRLEQARVGRATSADAAGVHDVSPGELGSRLNTALRDAGRMLGQRFLGETLTQAMADELARASSAGVPLRVGLEIGGADLVNLPWETITLPGHDVPLILSAPSELYRTVADLVSAPAMPSPAPLRILVVIASPDYGGGELLDYEAELSRILDAVERARRAAPGRARHDGKAYVRVLNWGSRPAIRHALLTERFHVLHVTCHAAAGKLVLESEDGGPDRVDASAFASDVMRDRGVPLVVLAACSTAEATPSTSGGSSGAEWRSMAQDLLARGVPAVLAMTSAVTDHYATELLSAFYGELAGRPVSEPLAALAEARRAVERARAALLANDPRAALSEWATPALFLRGPSHRLFALDAGVEPVEESPQPVLTKGIAVRGSEHFVGRRAVLRRLLRVLRSDRPAVFIHGLGGVGKSTLAAHLVMTLGESAGVIVSLSGTATVDQIMLALADQLSSWCSAHSIGHEDARHQLVEVLRDGRRAWQVRLAAAAEQLPPLVPVTLVLDNFEDNLILANGGPAQMIGDDSLAEFLARWLALPRSPLILTSRYGFPLPGDDRSWYRHHLGPLSPAESRKLVWRLPALDALAADEQRRAIADVGGHPRALEYLDALLRAGHAQFADIADRLEESLRRGGVTDPRARFAEVAAAGLDRQLAEAATATADDVLLADLLTCLDTVPLARQLLVGASVYRQPVDETGLMRLVTDTYRADEDPRQEARETDLLRRGAAAVPDWRTLGSSGAPEGGAERRRYLEEVRRHFEDLRRPRETPSGFAAALAVLLDLGLLTPLEDSEGTPAAYFVHRWTAAAIARLVTPEELSQAHRRAVTDYLIRVFPLHAALQFSLDNRDRVIYQMEAAFHLIQLNEPTKDLLVDALDRLHAWGMWAWEERVCKDTMAHIPEHSGLAAALCRRAGIIAYDRGDLPTAERWYRRALAIDDALGDESGRAADSHELGMIASDRHDWTQAEKLFLEATHKLTGIGQEHDLANTYNALGITATDQGKYTQAEEWFQKSIAIAERIQDRQLLANTLGELGIIARLRGDYPAATRWYRQSMDLKATTGDRLGYARGLGELATLALDQGQHTAGRELLHKALAIFQRLGNRDGISTTYANLGKISGEMGDESSAEHWYTEAVVIAHELGNPQAALFYDTLIRLAVRRKDYRTGEKWARRLVDLHSQIGGAHELAEACRAAASFCMINQDLPGAITYNLRGLKALPVDTPMPEEDLRLPRSLRSALGDDEFGSLLAQVIPAADANWLLAILDNEEGTQ